jgi:hypothetical protein
MASDDGGSEGDGAILDVLAMVGRALSGEPLELLGLASATVAQGRYPVGARDGDGQGGTGVVEHLVDRLVAHASVAARAYAMAIDALLQPLGAARSVRAPADGALEQLPRWLVRLDHARLERPTIVRDVFADAEWLLAGVSLAGGCRFAFRIEVDHARDGALVDALLMPTSVEEVRDRLRGPVGGGAVSLTDVDVADLTARFTEAVLIGGLLTDPPRTETWPSARPLVEWALTKGPTDRRSA